MPQLLNFREAVEALAACLDDDDMYRRFSWVYASEDVPLHAARFYLSSDEDECEEPMADALGREMPAFAVANNLVHYLEAATFVSVLSVQKEQQPLSSLDDFAKALKHYHEEDAFLDLGHFASDDGSTKAPIIAGISRELFAEYDLELADCPAHRVGDAARPTAAVLKINVGDALARCRQLPMSLGMRIGGRDREQIEARFAALSLPLKRTTHRSLAWLPPDGDGTGNLRIGG